MNDQHPTDARNATEGVPYRNVSLADLQAAFPQFSDRDAEKIWQTAVSRVAVRFEAGLTTFAESDKALADLLQLQIADTRDAKKPLTLRDCATSSARFTLRAEVARDADQRFAGVAARAHPLLWPVISEYQRCLDDILRGKTRGLAARFAAVEHLHTGLQTRMRDVDDYMNWFEATQVKTSSGTFGGLPSDAERSTRHDALTVYLDAMEQQIDD